MYRPYGKGTREFEMRNAQFGLRNCGETREGQAPPLRQRAPFPFFLKMKEQPDRCSFVFKSQYANSVSLQTVRPLFFSISAVTPSPGITVAVKLPS